MKVMILGAGGIGGYLAGKLSQQYGDITVVARGATLAAIREKGLTVIDGEETFTVHPAVTDKPEGIQDVIFICTKGYGLMAALEQIKPCVGPSTMVLPLLNGVNIYKRVEEVLPEAIALSGSIYVYANIKEPGVVQKNGPLLRIVMGVPGVPAKSAPQALHTLKELLHTSGIPTEVADDIIRENWKKWAMLVANGQANAYYNLPTGAIREDPEKLEFTLCLLRELLALARAKGIDMPENMEQVLLDTARNLPYNSFSSLARDMAEPGKPTELSLFAGELCRMAEECGIDAPANRSVLERFRDRL